MAAQHYKPDENVKFVIFGGGPLSLKKKKKKKKARLIKPLSEIRVVVTRENSSFPEQTDYNQIDFSSQITEYTHKGKGLFFHTCHLLLDSRL